MLDSFVRQGTAVPKLDSQYFDAAAALAAVYRAHPAIADTDMKSVPRLRYSSPMPWLLGLSMSLSIWAVLGWLAFRHL